MIKPPIAGLKRPPSHRTLLVDAMRSLALSKGLPATSVDEVCERAGVTKGSFYHHFTSKDELGIAALQAYFDDIVAAFTQGPWVEVTEPYDRLRAFLGNAAEICSGPLMAHGCLLGNFSLDIAESSPQVRDLVSEMFLQLRGVVSDVIAEAAKHRDVDLDPAHLGDQFLAVLEGSNVLAKAHADRDARRRGIEFFGGHLALLLDRPPTP